MVTTDANIRRWIRYVATGELPERARCIVPETPSVVFDTANRIFYSYGRHFPLAEYHPATRGRQALWIINGDRWRGGGWSQTSNHQAATRSAIAEVIAEAATRGRTVRSIVIPFSALDGAGIDRASIRPLHVRDDSHDTIVRRCTIPADAFPPIGNRPDPSVHRATVKDDGANMEDATRTFAVEFTANGADRVLARHRVPRHERRAVRVMRRVTWRGYQYGAAANDWKSGFVDYDPPHVTYYVDGGSSRASLATADDGTPLVPRAIALDVDTWHHSLGDALFTAAGRRPCGACDGRGIIVHSRDADSMPDDVTTCARCNGRRTVPSMRRRYLSSFDANEPAPLYFLATLPSSSRAATVEQAIDDLAPAAVHDARVRGLDVLRQGDIFLIPTTLDDATVYGRAKTRARLHVHTHGTNPHRGEVGYVPPRTAAQRATDARMRRRLATDELRRMMADDRRPRTPKGWRSDKRAELVKLDADIARHRARIAAGDDVCDCQTSYAHGGGQTCGECGRAVWYHGYTAANAERAMAAAVAKRAETVARPRKRTLGYCSDAPQDAKSRPHGRLYGRCYNRALSAWQGAGHTVERRHAPAGDTVRASTRAALAVYGTAHTATEVVTARGGAVYVRGTMRHVPEVANERRASDHRRLQLTGARWYLAIRNTVPRLRPTTNGR